MAYEKQTWETGDTITAEKLNHVENGIENNSTLVVTIPLPKDDPETPAGKASHGCSEIGAWIEANKDVEFRFTQLQEVGPPSATEIIPVCSKALRWYYRIKCNTHPDGYLVVYYLEQYSYSILADGTVEYID